MGNIAISVHGICKKYRLSAKRGGYRTLRDSIADTFTAPARAISSLFSKTDAESANGDDTLWALKDIEFEVPRGQVVGLIGRNGAGKSTLLKILSRITDPSSGYADIHGRVGSLLEVGTGFHPELSGRENIFLNGAILGMKRHEIDRKFDEIVAFAEVERFIDTAVKHYSSGMYLRLAFAVAAHLEPEILLVDEVLAVGDVAFQKKCMGRMENVAQEGRTVLFVSHNMGAVRSLCDRGIFLQDGCVTVDGDIGKSIEAYYSALGINNTPGSTATFQPTNSVFGPVRLNEGLNNTIHQADSFEVSTSLRIKRQESGFYFYCMLEDMMGRELVCIKESSTSLGNGNFPPGEYQLRAQFPPLWLVPGLYSISFKVIFWGDGGAASRHLSDKFPLDVSGESSSGSSTGNVLLQPKLKWSVDAATPA